nr:protein translocase subunit SecF [Desulfobacterales bacterium]
MELIRPDVNINFVEKRKMAFIFSVLLIIISMASLLIKGGPKYGIDFVGGTLIQIKFSDRVSPQAVKEILRPLGLENASVQQFGAKEDFEYLIRTEETMVSREELSEQIVREFHAKYPKTSVDVRRVEMVGPKVGKDLRQKALFSIFYALLFIAIYISGRFELKWMPAAIMTAILIGFTYVLSLFGMNVTVLIPVALLITLGLCWYLDLKFAMGAIVALIHDVIITVGVFSLTNKEFTLPIVAALLTIIGYSLNDTIIVFDRIRENMRQYRKKSYDLVINRSINETLSRTILTSTTTLIVVVALLLLGGGIIHDFAFALMVGIIVGTYSSIYVASPILIVWQDRLGSSRDRTRQIRR